MKEATVLTIGFTKTTAESFFSRLQKSGVKKVLDVRLHNTSQLSGFAKAADLHFFLKKIGNIEYQHEPLLAPTDDMLSAYKKQKGDWSTYEQHFLSLMKDRHIEKHFTPEMLNGVCLLCSEDKPHHCHRRLVCEYLNAEWKSPIKIIHL